MSQGFARCLLPYRYSREPVLFSPLLRITGHCWTLEKSQPEKLSMLKKIQILHFKKILFWLRVKVFIIYQFC